MRSVAELTFDPTLLTTELIAAANTADADWLTNLTEDLATAKRGSLKKWICPDDAKRSTTYATLHRETSHRQYTEACKLIANRLPSPLATLPSVRRCFDPTNLPQYDLLSLLNRLTELAAKVTVKDHNVMHR